MVVLRNVELVAPSLRQVFQSSLFMSVVQNQITLTSCSDGSKQKRLYSKSSLALNEWRFNLSFPCALMPLLNSCRGSAIS